MNLLQCALWCGRLIVYEKYTNQCGLCGEVCVEDPCGFIDGAGLGLGVPALGCQDVGVAHQLLGDLRADAALYQRAGELMPELVRGEVRLHDRLVQGRTVLRFLAGFVALAAVVSVADANAVLQPCVLVSTLRHGLFAAKDEIIIGQIVQSAAERILQGLEDRHGTVGAVGFRILQLGVVVVPDHGLAHADRAVSEVLLLQRHHLAQTQAGVHHDGRAEAEALGVGFNIGDLLLCGGAALFLGQPLGQLEQCAGIGVAVHLGAPILPDKGEHRLLPGNAFVGVALRGHVHQLAVDVGAGDLAHALPLKPALGKLHLVAVAPAGAILDTRLLGAPERLCDLAEGVSPVPAGAGLDEGRVELGLHLLCGAAIEVAGLAINNAAALDQAVRAFFRFRHVKTSLRYTLTSVSGGGTIRVGRVSYCVHLGHAEPLKCLTVAAVGRFLLFW